MRCGVGRLIVALFVVLLLSAVAVAWSGRHLALSFPGAAGRAASAPASPTERDGGCSDSAFDAREADRRSGPVATAC